MNIAIIGTGNVGSALGSSFTRAGHAVVVAGQDAAKAAALAERIGATSAATPTDAVALADIVVLAVPYTAAAGVVASMADQLAGKVVIDATNPLKADYSGVATADGPSGAERLAAIAGGSRFVKAFNTLFAALQADPTGAPQSLDALIATDDDTARHLVADLAKSIGLRPIDAGPLAAARELEALAWLNISLQLRTGGAWNSAIVLVNAPDGAIAA